MTLPSGASPERATPGRISRPIRVLLVDTAVAFGGTLVVSRNLLTHLDPRRIDASLVTACLDGFVSPGFAGSVPVRRLVPRVNYVAMGRWKAAIRRRVTWAPLRRTIELLAMAVEFLANLPYLIRLVSLYRALRVDIVHINNYTMEPMWAARLLGIPIIYHLHGFVSPNMDGSGRRNFQRIAAFVSISHAVTQSAVVAGIDRDRIHEIPNFVEQLPDTPPTPLPAKPAIGIFGRVTNWKGHKEFLRAAAQVLEEFPALRVYIVGDASDGDPQYFDECVEFARHSRYPENFIFTGRVTDVASYYRKCTVVVHASTWPEPFGMVLIEAMAEGRPVVASTFGAAREIIDDGNEGYLVDPRNVHSMATRITELLKSPAQALEMGTRGYAKVLRQYDPGAAALRFEALYDQIARSNVRVSHC